MAKKSEPAAMLQHYEELKARCTKYFTSIGHPKSDLDQLWRAVHQAVLTLKVIKTGKEKRIGIDKQNYPMVSRIIKDALIAGKIKGEDENQSQNNKGMCHFGHRVCNLYVNGGICL